MYELSLALKYLIPRRKQLSVSLIAFLSVGVISLVVWLVLVFLSVTEGIEKNWLSKLTALNAPIRITPTEHYYSSYYYLIDGYSAASQFSHKNIAEKAASTISDPYLPQEDRELPRGFPEPERDALGAFKDPVKEAYRILADLKGQHTGLAYQDFEISGALMRLQLLRKNSASAFQDSTQSFLTQVSYLASVPDSSPAFASMLLAPRAQDVNHLFYLSAHTTELAREDAPSLIAPASPQMTQARLRELLEATSIRAVKSESPLWKLSLEMLKENVTLEAKPIYREGQLVRLVIPREKGQSPTGKMWRSKGKVYFEENSVSVPLYIEGPVEFQVDRVHYSNALNEKRDIQFEVQTTVQNSVLSGIIPWENLSISQAHFTQARPPIHAAKETGVLLAKNYRDTGVLIGDRGYLSYTSATASSMQEQRLPIFVEGFYDPGILSVGNRCILVPPFVTRTINASSSTFNLDKTQANGILVWFDPVTDAEAFKSELIARFESAGISPHWKVATYKEYDYAKDLLLQFQSDKYLFSLIAGIILLVACCNIISLLTLLVNDKKREIGILQSMGASTRSIALIFGICGISMGLISGLLGACAAVFTLKHIDSIVQLLSFIQGHDAFNAAFFGTSLPNTLSTNALQFIFIITPILSLLAGLVPAIKACRLRPSQILRSE